MNTKLLRCITASTAFFSIVAMTGSAYASSYSKTASIDYTLTDIVNTPLTIEQFSGELGQLDSVTLDFTSSLLGDASVTNKGLRPTTVTITLSAKSDLTLNNQSLFTLLPTSYTSLTIGTLKTQPKQPVILTGLAATASDKTTYNTTTALQPFIGNGNLDFLFSANATSQVRGSGNLASNIDTSANATLMVTYNYTRRKKVAEPSATLGIGLIAGFCLLSQRKKSFRQIQNT